MSAVHVVVPDAFDDPRRPSGGNVYDRWLCEALGHLGWSVRLHAVPGPWPDGGAGRGADARLFLVRALAAIPDGELVVVDGLVGSGMPDVLVPESDRLRLVALVHMPLGSAGGREIAAVRLRESAVLERCAAVVATSRWSRRWMLDHYPLRPSSVVVAEPGVDLAEPAQGTATGGRLLCVGAVTPVKGHDVLLEALAAVRDLDWTCTCVGSTAIDAGFARTVARVARLDGIDRRLRWRGPLFGADLASEYAAADLLVLPSRAETYGMVVTEALGRGLPVIASDVGGVSEALTGRVAGEPGVLVTPDDPAALAGALRHWLTDLGWRAELRRRALVRRGGLVPWSATAGRVSQVLAALTAVPARR
ncbi:MAG: glycosyltransferase family 4 protein [Nocardioidaceae bacterium]